MAKRDLTKVPGTIANYLTNHQSEIFECGSDFNKMKSVTLKLLESEEIKDKKAQLEAINSLSKAKPSSFYSTLVSYMTGLTVC